MVVPYWSLHVDSTITFTGNTVLVGFGGAVTTYYTVIIEDLVMLVRNKAI